MKRKPKNLDLPIKKKHDILRQFLRSQGKATTAGLRFFRFGDREFYTHYRLLLRGIRALGLYSMKTPPPIFFSTVSRIAKEEKL